MYTSKHINNQHLALNTHTPIHTHMNIRLTCIYTNDYKNILILFQTYTYIHHTNHINVHTYIHTYIYKHKYMTNAKYIS